MQKKRLKNGQISIFPDIQSSVFVKETKQNEVWGPTIAADSATRFNDDAVKLQRQQDSYQEKELHNVYKKNLPKSTEVTEEL